MIIRAVTDSDREYDVCGNITIAILEHDNVMIPLCNECIKELAESIKEFENTVFCRNCGHWHVSNSGVRYGGTCDVIAAKSGKDFSQISKSDYGHIYVTDHFFTCKDAINKNVELNKE